MSRVAKAPVELLSGVTVDLKGQLISVKGGKGNLQQEIHSAVEVKVENNQITFAPKEGKANANALAGTMRSLVNNMVEGVANGFEKKLQLVGVGYRAKAAGKTLDLTLGFSHPVVFEIPEVGNRLPHNLFANCYPLTQLFREKSRFWGIYIGSKHCDWKIVQPGRIFRGISIWFVSATLVISFSENATLYTQCAPKHITMKKWSNSSAQITVELPVRNWVQGLRSFILGTH